MGYHGGMSKLAQSASPAGPPLLRAPSLAHGAPQPSVPCTVQSAAGSALFCNPSPSDRLASALSSLVRM